MELIITRLPSLSLSTLYFVIEKKSAGFLYAWLLPKGTSHTHVYKKTFHAKSFEIHNKGSCSSKFRIIMIMIIEYWIFLVSIDELHRIQGGEILFGGAEEAQIYFDSISYKLSTGTKPSCSLRETERYRS